MPNSQIDMVVRDDDGVRWNVCGDFQVPTEQLDPKIYVCVVVRQGDVIAHGDDVVSSRRWRLEVKPGGGEFKVGRSAIVTAVAIAQQDPSGLEAFTWAQRVNVLQRRTDGNPDPVFGEPVTVPGQGELAAGRAISSSLTVKEAEPRPATEACPGSTRSRPASSRSERTPAAGRSCIVGCRV